MKKQYAFILTFLFALAAVHSSNYPEIFLSGDSTSTIDFNFKDDSFTQIGFGGDIDFSLMFSDSFGANVTVGFALPVIKAYEDYNLFSSDYDRWYQVNTLIGPIFAPIKTKRQMLSLVPAFVFSYEENSYEVIGRATSRRAYSERKDVYTNSDVKVGIGGKISYDFFFKNGMFITSGLEAAYYFYHWTTAEDKFEFTRYLPYTFYRALTTSESNKENCSTLSFKPFIGFGYRFKH